MHPLAQVRDDQGSVEGSFQMSYMRLALTQTAAQQEALSQLLAAQRDPNSPEFRRWLTPEQYADRFGISRGDLAKIEQWLTSAGFSIEYTARGRNWIAFSGTAAQVGAAFHTAIHRFSVKGDVHYAPSSEPLLPEALAPLVGAVMGLHDFHPKSNLRAANSTGAGFHSLAPGDIATIYNLSPLYKNGIDGTKQKIVIVGQSDPSSADVQAFRSAYGLSMLNFQSMLCCGSDPGMTSDLDEADIDLEWAGAVARNAQLIYVYSRDADNAAAYAISQNLAPVISESYGLCEADWQPAAASVYESLARQANSQGITWIAASGDMGAADCDPSSAAVAKMGLSVNFPASVPEVTAVGGTEFNEGSASYWSSANGLNGGSATGYIPEMTWNDNVYGTAYSSEQASLSASGGGVSSLFAKPVWQMGPGVPADGKRDTPDVAFAGSNEHDPYATYVNLKLEYFGGTSVGTPVFAGIVALMNQSTGTSAGNVNSFLYSVATTSPGVFHDITTGNNMVPCSPGTSDCMNGGFGYKATAGYDATTGLGSIDAYNLITAWSAMLGVATVTASSLSPSSISAGAPGFKLTVNGSNFASASVVKWNGTALPTTFVNATQLTATLNASLIASPGTATVTVTSGASATGPLYFTAVPSPVTFGGQIMVAQQPSSCSPPPAVSFFATNQTPYVFFNAVVSPNDGLYAAFLAPDGTTIGDASANGTGNCYWFSPKTLANLTSSQNGVWSARVYDNGILLFSLDFTVFCGMSGAPSISSVDSASAYGADSYFASGSWLEIKGTDLADTADPRLTAATNPGQWTAGDFNGSNAPTSLDGVSVSIDGRPAYVWYLSSNQLNVQAPDDAATGAVSVTVSTCKGPSAPFQFVKQPLAPGLLAPPSFRINGTQYLVAQFQSDYAYVLNSNSGVPGSRPAKPGDGIIAYGIGFGDVTPAVLPGVIAPPQPTALNNPVTFSFGSAPAVVAYAGLYPGFVGLYEFYVTVPGGLANGDYQINVTQNGVKLPQSLFLTVHD